MKKMIIASTSTVFGKGYLEYLLPELEVFFEEVSRVLFIPYARPGGISHEEYTQIAQKGLLPLGIEVVGIHEFDDPAKALTLFDAVFTGGGNTFLLVKQLHELGLMSVLKNRVEEGMLYLGSSAGSNITGVSMKTTNDMPIVYPPSFNTLGLVPFNINPHYLDPVPGNTHMGETRETRIKEFHFMNDVPVIGLREGSWLHVSGGEITLKGDLPARVFLKNEAPFELESGSVCDFF